MKQSWLILLPLLTAPVATALAGNCPAQPPTSRGSGEVAGISGAGGTEYYFTDAKIDGFDCFRALSGWFPSYIHSTSSVNPLHEVVDMAYAHDATASFNNVVVPQSGPYTLTIRYAFAQGLFPGVLNRGEGVSVNGTVMTSAMDFPVTGDFEKFQTRSIVANLKAGANTIQMFNLDGASLSRVDTLTVTPAAAGACISGSPAPANVNGSAQSATQVNLTWSPSASPAACTVESYDVFRSTNSKFTPSADNEIANGLTVAAFDDKTALCNLTYYYSIAAIDEAGSSVTSAPVAATTNACPVTSAVAIKSGGPAVSSFKADEDFSGGGVVETTGTITTINVPKGLPMELFQSSRAGNFSYDVKGFAPNSSHTVTLYFIEPTFDAVGSRLFNVAINGGTVLSNFDIFLAAGDQDTPLVHKFSATANGNGEYLITFTPVLGDALVSGLQIK
jgi:Malectin domain